MTGRGITTTPVALASLRVFTIAMSICSVGAHAQIVKTVPLNDGAHYYATFEPEQQSRALLLMFIGGDGHLRLRQRGSVSGLNLLIRIRSGLTAAGFKLLYVDTPESPVARRDAVYSGSISQMIEKENSKNLPVFVIGISRGSISAANVASRQPVSGMILLSASTGSTHDGTVYDVPVERITAPSLLLLHRKDACVSSGSEHALRSFAKDLKNSTATVRVLEGGIDEGSGIKRTADCHPKSFHGFNGTETTVVDTLVQWIALVVASKNRKPTNEGF